jgi:hypothetical protein
MKPHNRSVIPNGGERSGVRNLYSPTSEMDDQIPHFVRNNMRSSAIFIFKKIAKFEKSPTLSKVCNLGKDFSLMTLNC